MDCSHAFRIPRLTLVAGVLTAVCPPKESIAVSVGNATSGDLYLYTTSDESEYLIVAAGYERPITLATHLFRPGCTAFWLKSAGGGTVVILWL